MHHHHVLFDVAPAQGSLTRPHRSGVTVCWQWRSETCRQTPHQTGSGWCWTELWMRSGEPVRLLSCIQLTIHIVPWPMSFTIFNKQ